MNLAGRCRECGSDYTATTTEEIVGGTTQVNCFVCSNPVTLTEVESHVDSRSVIEAGRDDGDSHGAEEGSSGEGTVNSN